MRAALISHLKKKKPPLCSRQRLLQKTTSSQTQRTPITRCPATVYTSTAQLRNPILRGHQKDQEISWEIAPPRNDRAAIPVIPQ